MGLALPANVGLGFVGLGIWLPGILLQDSYRFAFFSCGQAHRAFVNDLAWGAIQVIGVLALVSRDLLSPFSAMFVFGLTGTLAGGLGWWQSKVAPDPRRFRVWLVENKALGGRYLIENVALGGARQLPAGGGGVDRWTQCRRLHPCGGDVGRTVLHPPGRRQPGLGARSATGPRFASHSLTRFCAGLAAIQAAGCRRLGCRGLDGAADGIGAPRARPAVGAGSQDLLVPTLLSLMLLCVQNSWQSGLRRWAPHGAASRGAAHQRRVRPGARCARRIHGRCTGIDLGVWSRRRCSGC